MIRAKAFLCLGALVSILLGSSTPAIAAQKFEPVKDLTTTDVKVGSGAEATPNKWLTVNYTGWLYSYFKPEHKGTLFLSSAGHPPLVFKLGAGHVIKGLDQGIVGMKVGGKRTLIIPANLGYGERGPYRGVVPPNSPLVYDIELLDVKDKKN